MTTWALLGFPAAALVLSWGLAAVIAARAHAWGLMDAPNQRSAHTVPIPRGGGLGIVVAMAAALGLLPGTVGGIAPVTAALGLAALLATAAVGWVDDVGHLSPWIRLSTHILSGVLIAWVAGLEEVVHLLGPVGLPAAGVWIWWVFWTTSAINVSNFMDGIDGLLGLHALIYGLFVGWATSGRGDPAIAGLGFTLAASSLGFLILNWSPAKVFLGDVGSGGLGVVFVLLGVILIRTRGWTLVHAYLPLMPLFLDESVTLVRRVRAGDSIIKAHKKHIYQRLVHSGWGHATTTMLYGALSGLGALWVVVGAGFGGPVFLGGAVALLLIQTCILEGSLWYAKA